MTTKLVDIGLANLVDQKIIFGDEAVQVGEGATRLGKINYQLGSFDSKLSLSNIVTIKIDDMIGDKVLCGREAVTEWIKIGLIAPNIEIVARAT